MIHALELNVRTVPGIPNARVVRFDGELDASSVERVLEEITALLEDGVDHLVADFEQLRYVNSTGLGILLHFTRLARERGGSFRLCRVSQPVYEIIEIIGATTLLDIHDSLDEAIAAIR